MVAPTLDPYIHHAGDWLRQKMLLIDIIVDWYAYVVLRTTKLSWHKYIIQLFIQLLNQ